jgi:cytochrome c-type biogenesis protein CcmH
MAFLIVAAALGIAVTALLLAALMRGHVASEPAAAYDLRVYRDQLREIDRDLARGAVAGPEAERMRTEVSRRVLEADRALSAGAAADQAPRTATLAVAGVLTVVMAGGGWLYLRGAGLPRPAACHSDRDGRRAAA